jgi:hypothetical protein
LYNQFATLKAIHNAIVMHNGKLPNRHAKDKLNPGLKSSFHQASVTVVVAAPSQFLHTWKQRWQS